MTITAVLLTVNTCSTTIVPAAGFLIAPIPPINNTNQELLVLAHNQPVQPATIPASSIIPLPW